MRRSEPDKQKEEYLRLWQDAVNRVSPIITHLIASGEAKKFSADELSVQAHLMNDVVRLRQELAALDSKYGEKLSLQQQRSIHVEDSDAQLERINDYLQALLIGLGKDLTKTPELMEILKTVKT